MFYLTVILAAKGVAVAKAQKQVAGPAGYMVCGAAVYHRAMLLKLKGKEWQREQVTFIG